MKISLRLTVPVLVMAAFKLSAATLYVSLDSPNPTPPYATWATAATNIQAAVDAAAAGDTVLVTNGIYAVGNRETSVWRGDWDPPAFEDLRPSRVVVTSSITLESVNGPLLKLVQ